jgi:steroid delta-isomerase-like uncharacterized protein
MSAVDRHRDAHEEFNARDWAKAVRDFSTDTVYTDHPRGLTLKGPDQFIGWLQEWVSAFSDGHVGEVRYIDGGTTSVAQFRGTGTQDGPAGPLPASGKRMDVPFCEILRFDDQGRIVEGEMYYDQVTMLTQLGHLQLPQG